MSQVFQLHCGSFVSLGHYVVHCNTLAVIVGSVTDCNGKVCPILRQVSGGKLVDSKWVADIKACQKWWGWESTYDGKIA